MSAEYYALMEEKRRRQEARSAFLASLTDEQRAELDRRLGELILAHPELFRIVSHRPLFDDDDEESP